MFDEYVKNPLEIIKNKSVSNNINNLSKQEKKVSDLKDVENKIEKDNQTLYSNYGFQSVGTKDNFERKKNDISNNKREKNISGKSDVKNNFDNTEKHSDVTQSESDSSSVAATPSIAMMCPIIETDTMMCPHGGQVKLMSKKGKKFKSIGVPLILEPDLLNSPISGCSNPPVAGGPCKMIGQIMPGALSQKKFSGEKAVLQNFAAMVMTDTGLPLLCIPKPNKYKLLAAPANGNGNGKDNEGGQNSNHKPLLYIRLDFPKLNSFYIVATSYKNRANDSSAGSHDASNYSISNPLELNFKDSEKSDDSLDDNLKKIMNKAYAEADFTYKIMTIRVGYVIYEYIFLIPKIKPKQLKELSDDLKPYGLGRFMETGNRFRRKYEEDEKTLLSINTSVFKAPFGMQKLRLFVD